MKYTRMYWRVRIYDGLYNKNLTFLVLARAEKGPSRLLPTSHTSLGGKTMDRQRAAYLLQAHSSHLERPINNKPNCSPCVSNCKPRCGFVSKTACKRGRGGWGDGNYLKIPWWIPTPHLAVLHLQRQGKRTHAEYFVHSGRMKHSEPLDMRQQFLWDWGIFFRKAA